MLLQATKRSYTAPCIIYCLDNFYAEYHTSSLLSSASLKDLGPAHNSTKALRHCVTAGPLLYFLVLISSF